MKRASRAERRVETWSLRLTDLELAELQAIFDKEITVAHLSEGGLRARPQLASMDAKVASILDRRVNIS